MTRRLLVLLLTAVCLAAGLPASAQEPSASATGEAECKKLGTVLSFLRERNARDYAVTAPHAIDEGRYVIVGGIEQWITIRGEDVHNPVLLLLHGGPGDATNPWGYAGFRSWLKYFTVVQWDQRGAGRTLGKNGPSVTDTVSVERLTQDGIELAELLRTTLGKKKIVLVGHSWGSTLGIFMVKARPDLFHAFVGTGLVADPARNVAVAHDELLRKAVQAKDQPAIRELREIGPPPYTDGRGYAIQRKWANLFEGADLFIASMFGRALVAPGSTLRDVNDWLDGQSASAERLVPETLKLSREKLAGTFQVPVIVIQGAEDFTTPTRLAKGFVQSIHAPHKAFVTIEGGGHFAVFMKEDAFLQQLVARVLPLVHD